MATYPQMPEGLLMRFRALELEIGRCEGGATAYFKAKDCPYEKDLRVWLAKLFANPMDGVEEVENRFAGADLGGKFEVVIDEVEATIAAMAALEQQLKSDDGDAAPRIALMK